eukprot:s3790_g12.t1
MHISLERACQCEHQEACVFANPVCGRVQAAVFAYLPSADCHRVLISCLLLACDQREILLHRTEYQLNILLSSFSVATPPLQPFLQPVIFGQGGVWDLDWDSNAVSSEESIAVDPADQISNAVEEADSEAL